MRLRTTVLTAVIVCGGCVGMMRAQASSDAATPCVLNDGLYTCSWSALKDTLAAAKTVSVQSEPMDDRTNEALRRLARKLGKTVVRSRGRSQRICSFC